MRTQKQILKRLFILNSVALILCSIWLFSLANTTILLNQKENYYQNRSLSGLTFENTSFNISLQDVPDSPMLQYDKFIKKPVIVHWYNYVLFASISLIWMYWGDYVLYLYQSLKEVPQ